MWNIWGGQEKKSQRSRSTRRRGFLEQLERREVFSATPQPVLMVIANQDFYYREYGDTRNSLEAQGVPVKVAAATTSPAVPHANTGQGNSSGIVQPDIALAAANASDYSAIVFVGGWGASSYQYAFSGTYSDTAYNGNTATKAAVNDLISDFVAQDKYVAGICHGVTVLAWARVDGVSPLDGKQVSVPWIGSPAVYYQNQWYGYYQLQQYPQVVDNGAIANTVSGQYGNPNTVADDVVVDGKIITAENYDSAAEFGKVIAEEVSKSVYVPVLLVGPDIVVNGTPNDDNISVRSLANGQIMVAMNGTNQGRWNLGPGGHVKVFAGNGNDTIQARQATVIVELMGQAGDDTLSGGKADDILDGGSGNDRILNGGDGRDLILGGLGDDYLAGGNHDDILIGGEGNDQLLGQNGHDLILGGIGTDRIQGGAGEDLLIGGTTSYDTNVAALRSLRAAWTTIDDSSTASNELVDWGLQSTASSPGTVAERVARLQNGSSQGIRLRKGETVLDDTAIDELHGGADTDARFASALDQLLANRGDLTL